MSSEQFEFQIRRAISGEEERILQFFQTFYFTDEPLTSYLKVITHEKPTNKYLDEYLIELFHNFTPLLAVRDENIIGICMIAILKNGKEEIDPCPDEKIRKIEELLEYVRVKSNPFSKYCGCEEAISAVLLSVDPAHRKKGIGKQLLEKTRELGKQNGCGFMVVDCSSHFTARALKTLGFDLIYSLDYADYKVDGEVVFEPPSPHKTFTVYFKIIA